MTTASAQAWVAAAEQDLGRDWSKWAKNCHAASLHLIHSGILPAGSRVARGWCDTVPGSQHSWVVVNTTDAALADPYAPTPLILDPTAWSYQTGTAARPSVWTSDGMGYHPHGTLGPAALPGALPAPVDPARIIEPDEDAYRALNAEAKRFLALQGPLDARGWMALTKCDVRTYPAAEITSLMRATPRLCAFVPIDLWGMLTADNPSEVYL